MAEETEAERQERLRRGIVAMGQMGQGTDEELQAAIRGKNPDKLAEAVRRFGQATRAGRKISGLAGKEAFVRNLFGASPREKQEDPRGIHAMNQKIQQDYQKGIGSMITALVRAQTTLASRPQEAMRGISDALRMITSATNAEANSIRSIGQRDKADALDRELKTWVALQNQLGDAMGGRGRAGRAGTQPTGKLAQRLYNELGKGDKFNIVAYRSLLGQIPEGERAEVLAYLDSEIKSGGLGPDAIKGVYEALPGERTSLDSPTGAHLATELGKIEPATAFPDTATASTLSTEFGLADTSVLQTMYDPPADPNDPNAEWTLKPEQKIALGETRTAEALRNAIYGTPLDPKRPHDPETNPRSGGLMNEIGRRSRGVRGASLWGDAFEQILGKFGATDLEALVGKIVEMYEGADDAVADRVLENIEDQLGLERTKMKAPEAYVDPIESATRDIYAVPGAPGLPAKYGKIDAEKFWRQQGRRQLRSDAGREGARKRIISELGTGGALPTTEEKKEEREKLHEQLQAGKTGYN
jgi:hypothetical protein